jgi:acetolactate synthase I/II/III large subunit
MTTAAEAIALELKALGTSHFFLVTGGDNSIWIALQEQGVTQVLARNEASSVYMADAYARLSGRPTFVYGQYGPGASNVAGALAEPFWSLSPVVAMPTSMRRQHRHRYEYQELEQLYLFAGVSKWQAEAQIPQQVPHLVRAGAARATAAPPGPVYVGVPSDVLEQPIEGYTPPAGTGAEDVRRPWRPHAAPTLVEQAARLVDEAERPVIVAGNGVHLARAQPALAALAERLHVPVVTSLAGKGAIAEQHELAFGTVGRYSRRYANDIVREADLVLAVGSRLGGLVTDSYRLLPSDVSIVHVDIDESALGYNYPVTVGIQADAGSFLDQYHQLLDSDGTDPATDARKDRVAMLAERRAAWNARRVELAGSDGTDGREMRPEAVLDVINRRAPAETTVVADTGYAAAWSGALFETRRSAQDFLRADGSLGWAFPAALGAKLAVPDQSVLCVTGDGGFGYHVGELETARRLGIPVVVVILNNQSLAFELHVQQHLYGTVVSAVDDFVDVDYAAIARAFGVEGQRVSTGPEFGEVFDKALRSDSVTVIDALIAKDAIGPVTRYDSVREREL